MNNQIHISATDRGISDHYFCFTCDEYVWDCDHLIEERLTAARVPALDGSKLQSYAYDSRSRILEVEFRVRAPFAYDAIPFPPPGPCSIGIDTLEKTALALSEDQDATEEQTIEGFLGRAGVSKQSLEFFRSRISNPIQFYSAFISYSTKDQDFADRLYADLREKNIRCWLATEDLKIGDKFRMRINDAIRIHDKLLVVLSEHSVKSAWVEDEVEAAFERERRDGTTVLFPIRLDDAVMECDAAWAATIRRTRHIGDFRKWKDHDEYQKALARLIRDLQADEEAKSARKWRTGP